MRVALILFVHLFCLNVFSQDSLTIVAVGEAENESEKIAFVTPQFEGEFTSGEISIIQDIIKIHISDFSFYKHLYDVNQFFLKPAAVVDKMSFWKKESYRYVIESILKKDAKGISLNTQVNDLLSGKAILANESLVELNNKRNFAHSVSNSIYKAITGKNSIFNSKIVFVSDRTSNKKEIRKEIYVMDFDGERKQRLTYANSMIISPSISPDNKKILYSIIESKWKKSSSGKIVKVKNINLYEMNLLNKAKTKISQLDGINSGAIYTHDGESIYLTLSHLKNADIYKMNLKSKVKTRVTRHYSDDVDPHINAAGDLMTFLSGRSGRAMIYTTDPRNIEKNVKRISYVGRFNAAPRFSPDGREIVFSSWVDNRFDLYKIDSNGNNLVRLTKNFGSNEEPWFSPDGQFIVFSSQRVMSRTKAVQNIYIMNREGEIIRKITNKYGKCYTPRWSN